SSRRRHTRWPRDWSSDVCSSDLGFMAKYETWLVSIADGKKMIVALSGSLIGYAPVAFSPDGMLLATIVDKGGGFLAAPQQLQIRTEERRVGRECRGEV